MKKCVHRRRTRTLVCYCGKYIGPRRVYRRIGENPTLPTERECIKCKVTKTADNFYVLTHKQGWKYLASQCNQCKSDINSQRKFDAEFREMRIEYVRKSMKKYPEKDRARRVLRTALETGKVIRQPCGVCGSFAEGHHFDYSKPLDVIWLCRQHHAAHHAGKLQLQIERD